MADEVVMKFVSQEELFGLGVWQSQPYFEVFPAMAAQQRRAREDASLAEILDGGKVAIIVNPREMDTIYQVLPEKGVQIVVYVEDPHGTPANPSVKGHNLGIARCSLNAPRADHSEFRAIVEAAGETDEWFAEPSGSYFARGADKPRDMPSKVSPRALAEAAARLLDK